MSDTQWAVDRMVSLGWMPRPTDPNWSFDAALIEYQVWAGLPATGWLDAATVESLRRPRFCGHPDRMVTEDLRRNPTATWRFAGPALPTVGVAETRKAIQDAFDCWSEVCPISAVEADASDPSPSILIVTTKIDHRNGVLADCELPGPRVQRMRLDTSESWVIALPGSIPSGRIGLDNVLRHELGHFWGLGHISDGNLMAPIYDPDLATPRPGDVAAMGRLYPGGPAKPPSPTPPAPSGDVVIRIKDPRPGQIEIPGYKVTKL